jgi:hypothetical protein
MQSLVSALFIHMQTSSQPVPAILVSDHQELFKLLECSKDPVAGSRSVFPEDLVSELAPKWDLTVLSSLYLTNEEVEWLSRPYIPVPCAFKACSP